MIAIPHRTKIVATIGPASNSPEVIKQLIEAGLNVARLNFSHGSYEDHAHTVSLLRSISEELNTPITILQDLQGPKIRISQLPNGAITLEAGANITLIPLADDVHQPGTVGIDYPYLAEEAKPGTQILLDDGLLELEVESVEGNAVICKVITGGLLKS
ncbi:MAG: pyruvate kinase, partial [Microcoleaceae cyanobacterium MO_207.B10]|nr:pyruvate kinase [Microcoleaceae cyanobacterium MO_207.B10]